MEKIKILVSDFASAVSDLLSGAFAWRIWGKLGWADIKRRYRRTVIGPLWTTLSLSIFCISLSIVWSQLWHLDPKEYLPFLTSGLLVWGLVSALITEGCGVFFGAEAIIKTLPIPYTLLACAVVWRNFIVLLHNLVIYLLVMLWAGVPVTSYTLLAIPGLFCLLVNGVWVVTLLGSICSRFRDIQQVMTSLLQISMFVTPIFWQPAQLSKRTSFVFVDMNPLYHYVDIVRAPLLGNAPSLFSWGVVTLLTFTGIIITMLFFGRVRAKIPYWI